MSCPTTFFFLSQETISGRNNRLRTLLGKLCPKEVSSTLGPLFLWVEDLLRKYGHCCCCCSFIESQQWIWYCVRSLYIFSSILTITQPGEYEISILPLRKLRSMELK